MKHAYDRLYLERARQNLGHMFDVAVYRLGCDLPIFVERFLSSDLAEGFGRGVPAIIVGRSGTELAIEVLERTEERLVRLEGKPSVGRSRAYWTGWALAYYQWYTGIPFREILKKVPIETIESLYEPYHEMDIRHFVEKMHSLFGENETKLKRLRQNAGLSQRQLAQLSGIPVRTIQQYEQRQKDINKAQAAYLLALTKVFCCDLEDLMEYTI